jgi:hypothetical protein
MGNTGLKIIEHFVQGKNINTTCEDMVANLDNFIVVLDGVTGKDTKKFKGLTGGRFAATTVMSTLEKLPGDVNGRSCINVITQELALAIKETAGSLQHPPGTQVAIYSKQRREIWAVGDIHIRIGEEIIPNNPPPTDSIATNFRAALLSSYIEEGVSEKELMVNDPSWELMLPLLSRQDVFANRSDGNPFSYGIVNGTLVPDQYLLIREVPRNSEVVLASDGYLTPEGTLKQAEARLKQVLKQDPLLINLHKSFRATSSNGSFDDRAWIRFIS